MNTSRANLNRRHVLALAAGMGAPYALTHAGLAHAQQPPAFPNKPITLYLPFPPGGTTDSLIRKLTELAGKILNQPLVIENRPGVSGTMAASVIVRAQATGYALALLPEPVFRLPHLQKVDFDPLNDFTYIIHLAGYRFSLMPRPNAPWKQWSDLVADAKAHPGKITYGSTGVNGTIHVTMAEIAQKLGIEWVHVPYKGESDTAAALLGGHIDLGCVQPQWFGAEAHPLVQWTATRSKRWPDVPTLREVGVDIVANSPFGIAGPKGMEPQAVKIVHDAFKQALDDSAVVELVEQLNLESDYLNSADYDRFARQRYAYSGEQVKRLGLTRQQ